MLDIMPQQPHASWRMRRPLVPCGGFARNVMVFASARVSMEKKIKLVHDNIVRARRTVWRDASDANNCLTIDWSIDGSVLGS